MKQHPKYTKYICNDKGEVLSLHTGRKLDPAPNLNGYIQLSIQDNGEKRIRQYSHRLIYECYHGLIPEGFDIDHIDGNRANNCILNLACLTRAEHRSKTYVDNPHIVDNLHKANCKKVLRVSALTAESTEFASVNAAALGVMGHIDSIRNAIKSGKTFRKFVWRFVEECDLEGESWEPVVDRNNNTVVFKVSNLGRLQYANSNNKTFGHKTAGGYRFWYLRNNYAVHHLICQVFHGAKPTSAHTVDHINRDPFDNRPENLRWATKKEQARNRSTVRTVHGYVLNTGILLGIWPTITDAAAATGTHRQSIGLVLRGRQKSGGKTENGEKITWRYKESDTL